MLSRLLNLYTLRAYPLRLYPLRMRPLWLLLCTVITLLVATSQIRSGRGATPDLLPLPIDVPVPEQVLFEDNFGAAMAIDGDILAVGAPNTAVNGNAKQGVVYLYLRDSSDPTAFTLLKTITGSDSDAHDSFGSAVAIHGETLVAGSHDSAAYVFERNQGGANQWGEVKKLVRGDDRQLTYFGRSLAIHGDSIVVGAALGLGEVFIFQRDQEGADQWGKTQILDSGLPITTSIKVASFGEVIAFNGETLAISAPGMGLRQDDVPDGSPPVPGNYFGAVFVYRPENGQWLPEAKLFSGDIDLAEDPMWDDSYGQTLALNGNTLFVGAINGRVNSIFPGKVFVYHKDRGAVPPFGTPGGWGEIAHLSPDDGASEDAFGTSLYAVDDALFVGAPRQGIGKVYFFRNPAIAQVSDTGAQPLQFWGQLYSFSPSTEGSPTSFGNPIAGSGSSVLFGNQPASGGSHAINVYTKEALFAHDPEATATPPTGTPPTETPPPDDAEPCLPEAQAQGSQLFLPSVVTQSSDVVKDTQSNDAAAIATPNAPTALFTDILAPGCLLTSPDGIGLAAVQGAITQSIAISIESVVAPPEALPAVATPLGSFLRIAAKRTEHTPIESPFVIAIPVPPSADAAHLVIAHLVAPTDTLDSEVTGNRWSFLPGVYDASTKLFLARLPFLRAQGTTLVLLQHPDFASPANQPQAGAQVAATESIDANSFGGFSAYCIYYTFTSRDHCTGAMEDTVEGILDDIYLRMTDSHFFKYPTRLRLLDAGSQFIVSNQISVTNANLTYAVYLMGPKQDDCDSADGYYLVDSGFLALCIEPGTNTDAGDKDVLIHEFFHAVQYTYGKVFDDYDFGKVEQLWVIEGMADAAINSFPDIKMQRSTSLGENALKLVDEPLTQGVDGDDNIEEYLAQDFWVYVGLSEGESLAYLGPVLQIGGSGQNGINSALQTLYGKSLGEFDRGWVKHQAIENTYDVGSGPGELCSLTEDALSTGRPVEFPSYEQVYPFATQSAFDRLQPLTAKVIEIEFGEKSSAMIGVGYERCAGLVEPTARAACIAIAQEEIKVKIYEEGEFNCHLDELPGVDGEGRRTLTSISPDLRYFAVVANIDIYEEHGYYITIE